MSVLPSVNLCVRFPSSTHDTGHDRAWPPDLRLTDSTSLCRRSRCRGDIGIQFSSYERTRPITPPSAMDRGAPAVLGDDAGYRRPPSSAVAGAAVACLPLAIRSSRACRKLQDRLQIGLGRSRFYALLTSESPKQNPSSRFCSWTVQAPAKPKPLRSHSMASNPWMDLRADPKL